MRFVIVGRALILRCRFTKVFVLEEKIGKLIVDGRRFRIGRE